jgi:hypothetical protein
VIPNVARPEGRAFFLGSLGAKSDKPFPEIVLLVHTRRTISGKGIWDALAPSKKQDSQGKITKPGSRNVCNQVFSESKRSQQVLLALLANCGQNPLS